MENPIKMDDLEVPLLLETPIMKQDRVGLSMTQTTQRPRPCRCLHGTDRPFSRFFSRRILAGWKKNTLSQDL